MKTDIILCGVGGQGILSIATIIGEAAMKENLYIKQAEVHGMSQRGGDVQSNLRISSLPISSDLIPLGGADVIISMEPMEALRYLPFLSKTGWIITSSTPFVNIPNYPDIETIKADLSKIDNVIMLDIEPACISKVFGYDHVQTFYNKRKDIRKKLLLEHDIPLEKYLEELIEKLRIEDERRIHDLIVRY